MEPLVIAHFNDVYEIEDQDTGKGAARFSTVLQLCANSPLVLFSGDCFSPSHSNCDVVSDLYRGADMVAVLNRLGVSCATIGNHDVDFGLPHLRTLLQQTGFPWVQSNLREASNSLPMAGAAERLILSWRSWKVGLIGLAEAEWLDIIGSVAKELLYEDYCEAADRNARALKEAGCDIVIALTHMRVMSEVRLAQRCGEIDLILGGHDHLSKAEMHSGCPVIKSGSDFEELTVIEVHKQPSTHAGHHGLHFNWRKIPVTADIPQDPDMEAVVQEFVGGLDKKIRVLARVKTPMDCRFTCIRSEESEVGNWLSDIVRMKFAVDVVLINAGHVRLNGFIPAGYFSERDLHALLSVKDNLCRLSVRGSLLLQALNSSFEKLPALEGRFPLLSGTEVTVDLSRTPRMYSLLSISLTVQNEPLDPHRDYSLITTRYVAQGNDGYNAFLACGGYEEMNDTMVLTCVMEFLLGKTQGPYTDVIEDEVIIDPKKDGRIHIAKPRLLS